MEAQRAMITIQILGSDTSTGDLLLKENGGNRTNAQQGDRIMWIIHPDSGVDSIIAITIKTGSTDVFITGDPHKLGSSENWQGEIKKFPIAEPGTYIDEFYDIVWKDSAGNEYTHDPQIRVNV